jgi:hypothetical protein
MDLSVQFGTKKQTENASKIVVKYRANEAGTPRFAIVPATLDESDSKFGSFFLKLSFPVPPVIPAYTEAD